MTIGETGTEPSLAGFPAAVVGAFEMFEDLAEQHAEAQNELRSVEDVILAGDSDDEVEIERARADEIRRRLSVLSVAVDKAGVLLTHEIEAAKHRRTETRRT